LGITVQCVPEKWIGGQGGPTEWSAPSPGSNLLDFYLWDHLQSAVCTTEFSDIQDLQ